MIEREVKAEVWIPLSQGKVAVIDFDDFEKVRHHKWYAHKMRLTYYARRSTSRKLGKQRAVFLHREIMQTPTELEVDHRDGDGLNCRRENMRNVTDLQNALNRKLKANKTSKYRGVSFCQNCPVHPWRARIAIGRHKSQELGVFSTEDAAARAYDTAAHKLFGEWAMPNFPKI